MFARGRLVQVSDLVDEQGRSEAVLSVTALRRQSPLLLQRNNKHAEAAVTGGVLANDTQREWAALTSRILRNPNALVGGFRWQA
jgi:hypothetical protein